MFNGARITLTDRMVESARKIKGKLELGIRPMYLEIHSRSEKGSVQGKIKTVEDQGSCKVVTVMVDDCVLHAKVQEGMDIPESKAWLKFPPKWTKLFVDGKLIS